MKLLKDFQKFVKKYPGNYKITYIIEDEYNFLSFVLVDEDRILEVVIRAYFFEKGYQIIINPMEKNEGIYIHLVEQR